jgi:hypothetical protein
MTDADRFKAILADIDFRGWTFNVGVDGSRCYLQIGFVATDYSDPERGKVNVWKGRKWLLSPHMTRSEVVQTAFLAVITAVEHEAREAFHYRNCAIFCPHFTVDALVDLTKAAPRDAREDHDG